MKDGSFKDGVWQPAREIPGQVKLTLTLDGKKIDLLRVSEEGEVVLGELEPREALLTSIPRGGPSEAIPRAVMLLCSEIAKLQKRVAELEQGRAIGSTG